MNFNTVEDIYSANESAREKLINVVKELSDKQANLPTENGKWTIAGIAEHLAMTSDGMSKICYKLLSKAKEDGNKSDGKVNLSASFIEGLKKTAKTEEKFEAPEQVSPKVGQSTEKSIEMLNESSKLIKNMLPLFKSVDGTQPTFPHPYFGKMSAQDWLVLLGFHETRHTEQIESILKKHE